MSKMYSIKNETKSEEPFDKILQRQLIKIFRKKLQMAEDPEETEKIRLSNCRKSLLEQWFIRVSWSQKLDFLRKLLQELSFAVVQDLAYEIEPPTKDVVYACSQPACPVFDSVPFDTNRTVDLEQIEKVKAREIPWVKTLLETKQVEVITDLLYLGGSALQREIYKEAVRLLPKLKSGAKKKVKKERISAAIKCTMEEAKKMEKLADYSTENDPERTRRYSAATEKLSTALYDWAEALKKLEGSINFTSSKGQEFDQIQLLPIWVNRYIFSMLDREGYVRYSKVSPYWEATIYKVKREIIIKKRLEQTIKGLEVEMLPAPPVLEAAGRKGSGQEKQGKKRRNSLMVIEAADRNRPTSATRRAGSSGNLKNLTEIKPVERESIQKILPQEFKEGAIKNAYTGIYRVFEIDNKFLTDRLTTANRSWLATCETGKEVWLYTMRTGGRCKFPSLPATALFLHPSEEPTLITGHKDGTIRSWEIWSREENTLYCGHTKPIVLLKGNSKFLASLDSVNNLNIFAWSEPFVHWGQSIEIQVTCMELGENNRLYFGNTSGGFTVADVLKKETLEVIEWGHLGRITDLAVIPPVLLTSGSDGFIRAWHCSRPNLRPMVSIQHKEGRVNKVFLSHLAVLAASENGVVSVFDVMTGQLKRKIEVNSDSTPILEMHLLELADHSKIITNCETGVTLLDFPLKKGSVSLFSKDPKMKKAEKAVKPQLEIEPIEREGLVWRTDGETRKERRIKELRSRWSSHPGALDKSGPTMVNSILTEVLLHGIIPSGAKLEVFPRRVPVVGRECDERGRLRVTRRVGAAAGVEGGNAVGWWRGASRGEGDVEQSAVRFDWLSKPTPKTVVHITYKDFLPIYNPYKFQ